MIAVPLSIPIGLEAGKAIGEVMEWGKAATVTAEIGNGVISAFVLALAITFFFGKEAEVTEKKHGK